VKGVAGAMVSAFASVLTPFAAIVALSAGLSPWFGTPTMNHVFLGVRAATAALILLSLVKLAKKVFDSPLAWTLGALSFLAAIVFRVDVTYVILFGFAVGVILIVVNALRRAKP